MADANTVLTKDGIEAIIDAGVNGPQVNIEYFKIGSEIITPTVNMTDVATEVFVGNETQVEYQKLDESTIQFVITLNTSIGNFTIGNIGIFTDTDKMFAITALPNTVQKYAIGSGPNNLGNHKVFRIIMHIDGGTGLLNLTLFNIEEAAVPVVQTEADLPSALVAPFPLYVVNEYGDSNAVAIAVRYGGFWNFIQSAGAIEDLAMDWALALG